MTQSPNKVYGTAKGPYTQKSIRARILALFLDNVGKIITRSQIIEVATDPVTGRIPENWHQRLSELRTDSGYTILSARDRKGLAVSEYVLAGTEQRVIAGRRVGPTPTTWEMVLEKAGRCCEWQEGGQRCSLADGDPDPIGGGTVRLTPDHKRPHAVEPLADRDDPDVWQALCGRHQVMKKNYWDDSTGWLNVQAIIQSASERVKRAVFVFLKRGLCVGEPQEQ